jgi:hypothetical protein
MVLTKYDVPSPGSGELEKLDKLLSSKKSVSNELDKQRVKFDELQAVISDQAKIENEINKNIPAEIEFQTVLKVQPEKVREVIITLTKKLISQGKTPVLVLTTTNYQSAMKLLSEASVDLEKVKMIDCVTRNVYNAKNTNQIYFIDSLRNLTQLQIKIVNFFEKDKNSAFVFDSLDTLELYHSKEVIFKFVHSATKILRQRSLQGYFIFADGDLVRHLTQFFDSVIDIQ